MVERFVAVPSPLSSEFFQQLGNAASRVEMTATAFIHAPADEFFFNCRATWLDPKRPKRSMGARAGQNRCCPRTAPAEYANHLGLEADEGSARIKAAYGANYQRLVALKSKYDRTNLFRHNQNIRPTA